MLAKYKGKVAPLVVIGILLVVLAHARSEKQMPNEVTGGQTPPPQAIAMLGVLVTGIGLCYWAAGSEAVGWKAVKMSH